MDSNKKRGDAWDTFRIILAVHATPRRVAEKNMQRAKAIA